jgi:ABC-type dipeptide/oligopeptide/nickel transport system ATPase component/ABC-type dipeptide/oligopeptide/nickel transport system permease subunit
MTDTVALAVAPAIDTRRGIGRALLRLLRNPLGVVPLVILVALVAVAVFAPLIAPFDPNAARVELTNVAPFVSDYLLGGDAAGRDVLSRLIWATRGTLLASVVVLVVSLLIGGISGLLAGYYRGTAEVVGNWVSDVILALPGVVLLIALYAVIGPNILLAMAVYGVVVSPIFYRLVRSVVVAVRTELYIDAAKVAGLGDARIIFRHVLRAVRSPIIIQSAFLLGAAVGIQAALEFLGLGSPREASWGGMLDLAFRNLYVSGTGVAWPALVVTITVLAFVLLGNALRDALDPGSKRTTLSARATRRLREDPTSEPPPADALLTVRGLRIGYPVPGGVVTEVVRGIDFEVRRGEILGLVGESGSGKSQTAFSVLGLLPRNAVVLGGSVVFDGIQLLDEPVAVRKVLGRRIAYVPQEPMSNLDPTRTVGDQLVRGLRATTRTTRAEARAQLLDLLRRVGIADPERVWRAYPHEISGGMAQRVLITGAIASDPDLIIADEPTTALDVTVQAEVLDIIRGLRDDRGLAVVLVTHNLGVVADLCDRVAVMRHGELVETATVADFFEAPTQGYSRELLSAAEEVA